MRTWKWIAACGVVVVLTIACALEARRWEIRPLSSAELMPNQSSSLRHVLLPESETAEYARDHLPAPGLSMGSWQPSQADLAALEAALPQISEMRAQSRDPRFIADPDQYFLQYLPIVLHGKRRIFVNAFCGVPSGFDWHTQLVEIIDGGKCYWQVYYDPASGKFSNLTINGQA